MAVIVKRNKALKEQNFEIRDGIVPIHLNKAEATFVLMQLALLLEYKIEPKNEMEKLEDKGYKIKAFCEKANEKSTKNKPLGF